MCHEGPPNPNRKEDGKLNPAKVLCGGEQCTSHAGTQLGSKAATSNKKMLGTHQQFSEHLNSMLRSDQKGEQNVRNHHKWMRV